MSKKKKSKDNTNIILPTEKPSTHPLFPVWKAYNDAYQDRSLHNRSKYTQNARLDVILGRTIEAARKAGFKVNNFNKDLYPLLQPWIVACGEPKGIAQWRKNLVHHAEEVLHLPSEEAAKIIRTKAMKEGIPLGVRQSEELLRDVAIKEQQDQLHIVL
jgi:hypothetical protein